MLTKEQVKFLRKEAQKFDSHYQIGKNLIGPNQIELIDNGLRARELIKITLQKSAVDEIPKIIEHLTLVLNCELVEKRGHVITLFRQNLLNPRYKLPK